MHPQHESKPLPSAAARFTRHALDSWLDMDKEVAVTNHYAHDVLINRNLSGLYNFVLNHLAWKLQYYPAVTLRYGTNEDAWAMKFIYFDPTQAMDSLDYDEANHQLNPDIIRLLQTYDDAKDFEKALRGEMNHWISDLFDKTEFGRTRRVLERDMEEQPNVFTKVLKSNLWRLTGTKAITSSAPESLLWPVAAKHKSRITWPPKKAFDDFRNGKRERRPQFRKQQVRDMLHDVLEKADGAVDINVLTRLFIKCQPYIALDLDRIQMSDVDFNRMQDDRSSYLSFNDDEEHDAYDEDNAIDNGDDYYDEGYDDDFGGEW